jgi:hypothetical protein
MTMRSERHHKTESLKRALEDPAFSDLLAIARPRSEAEFPLALPNRTMTGRVPNSCPNPAHLRSLMAIQGQPFSLHVRKRASQSSTVLVFQAGHASSILVTRST